MPLREDIAQEQTQNTCSESSECGAGVCRSGMCQAGQTKFPALLLGITPPSGFGSISGIEFLKVVDEFQVGLNGYEIELGRVSHIQGVVSGYELSGAECLVDNGAAVAPESTDRSVPVRVTLTPRERLLGLPSPVHTTEVEVIKDGSYEFSLNVPPGRYDIYVEPLATDDGCVRPPYLIVDQEFISGEVSLSLELPAPQPLGVTVRYPQITDDLRGWGVDIVERDSGRLLSNRAQLAEPVSTDEGLEYIVNIAFSEVQGDQTAPAAELVRLSPPEGAVAPTLYVERSVVDLFQGGEGLIDQLVDLPDPVLFRSRVTTAGSPAPALSTVLLTAVELQLANPGTVAAYFRTVETDEQGYFEVELLPGLYRVSAEPHDPALARTEVEFSVSDSSETQNGKTIEVRRRREVTGRVVSFTGKGVAGAPLWVAASPRDKKVNVLEEAQGKLVPTPLAIGAASEGSGNFSVLADKGLFYLAARPEASSGFAWSVVLGVDVENRDVDLGRVDLSLPVVVSGVLKSKDLGGDVVSDALIRVYAYLKDGELAEAAEDADSVIAVGESRVDAEGSYRLLLPSAFK